MTEILQPQTERLRLRQWRDADLEPFARLNSDSRVMEHFPQLLTREASDAMAARCSQLIAQRGWGFWAAEIRATHEFIGFVGLHVPIHDFSFSPCFEVGWRLAFDYWGKGYATEAATAALQVAFNSLALHEVVSFTTLTNARSQAVMQRIGMRPAGTFDHPAIEPGHPLRSHCLYRITAADMSHADFP